uniref:EF-hand domain-containing protein n=1 Tax=Populus trichocarpa TaxID=3694 RepID=A0A3N7F9Z2_POPTR
MEEVRRAAVAYYENLSEEKKRNARFSFNEMDKNGDGRINLHEYLEYLKKDNNTILTHPSLFTALDKDGNGSLDFEETIVLYYIMQSGRALICQSCNTFLADVYFSCSQCFFKDDSDSTYEICCDCYGGKRFTHHADAIFCDNYTLLSQSRSLALKAPVQVTSPPLTFLACSKKLCSFPSSLTCHRKLCNLSR